jgi:DNA-binding response OmpR family regulator
MHILLIEDEAELAATLKSALQRERYVVDLANTLAHWPAKRPFQVARSGAAGPHPARWRQAGPDSGAAQAQPRVPIIVLSALGQLPDRIAGLDEGADDYLAKPFAAGGIFARIRAAGRRPGGMQVEPVSIGRLLFDPPRARPR